MDASISTRAAFTGALVAGSTTSVAHDGLSYGDLYAITDHLKGAGLLERQANSFVRFYELAAKQNPRNEKFAAFHTALTEYKGASADNGKKVALFNAACTLADNISRALTDGKITDANFKSALANACLGSVDALKDLATKDGFRPDDNTAANWPQSVLPHFQAGAVVAKLAKRGIPTRKCTMEDAVKFLKENAQTKVIGSKIENGKLVFCEMELNADRTGLVEKKKEGRDGPVYESSKTFAQAFNPTAGETPTVIMQSRPAKNAENIEALRACISDTAHEAASDDVIWNAFCALADEREKTADDGGQGLLERIKNDENDAKTRFNALLAAEMNKTTTSTDPS
ncbi:MAG: hypothetical protein LBD72_02420 [Puniceicoccales bacterium]|nr:hypothetical protein [Puniceicoccales bacterium]